MTQDILLFFDSHPQALPLYVQLEAMVLEVIPDTRIQAQKSQITLRNRRNYGAVSFLPVRKKAARPDTYITVTFGLDHPVSSPRIDAKSEPYPNRWTHHVLVASAEEIDGELLGWLREAAAFSAGKR